MKPKSKTPKPKVKIVGLEDLVDDPSNSNRGTERGHKMLEMSVQKLGAARSMVIDKGGVLVAGNKTREALVNAGFTHAIVVETDGKSAVVVQRKDWDISDRKGPAREYAYFDNRTSEIDLDWDPVRIMDDLDSGVDLSALFSDAELASIVGTDEDPPAQFSEYDENIPTQHQCPKCGYEWSGSAS